MTNLVPSPSLDTWFGNKLITADLLNSNIRDAQKFLAYAPLTIVSRATSQSIPNSTQTAITFDTEIIDVDGMFTAPSANLTVQRPGVYSIQFQSDLNTNATDVRSAQITVNGVMVATNGNIAGGFDATLNLSAIVACNTGDVIQGTVWQDSGAALNAGWAGGGAPRLAVRLISTALISVAYLGGGAAPPPAPPPSKPPSSTPTKHTATFKATWSRSYDGGGNTRYDDSPYCYQGGDTANTANGDQKSLIGFNYTAIRNTLAGATNISGTFTFKVIHCWYNAGSPIYFALHKYTSKPSTWSQSNVNSMGHTGAIAPGTVYTANLSSTAITGFKNGTYAGMGFGPAPSTSLSYYAYMAGATQNPAPTLTFTYWK